MIIKKKKTKKKPFLLNSLSSNAEIQRFESLVKYE